MHWINLGHHRVISRILRLMESLSQTPKEDQEILMSIKALLSNVSPNNVRKHQFLTNTLIFTPTAVWTSLALLILYRRDQPTEMSFSNTTSMSGAMSLQCVPFVILFKALLWGEEHALNHSTLLAAPEDFNGINNYITSIVLFSVCGKSTRPTKYLFCCCCCLLLSLVSFLAASPKDTSQLTAKTTVPVTREVQLSI